MMISTPSPIEWGWGRRGRGERWSWGPVGKRFQSSFTYRKNTSTFTVWKLLQFPVCHGSQVLITSVFPSLEWDDCRREAKSPSKRTGSSTQWGSKEAINWTMPPTFLIGPDSHHPPLSISHTSHPALQSSKPKSHQGFLMLQPSHLGTYHSLWVNCPFSSLPSVLSFNCPMRHDGLPRGC